MHHRRTLIALAVLGALVLIRTPMPALVVGRSAFPADHSSLASVDLSGVVTDSNTTQPLESAEVSVSRSMGGVVANAVTDPFGRFTIHNVGPGSYVLLVRLLGYRPVTRALSVTANEAATRQLSIAMTPVGLNLSGVRITAVAPVTLNTRSGNQVFNENAYHGAPTTTTSQILQQTIAGAARAPTGEVHIRGQHAEYMYYVDGVPVPPGISGSLNELFDPQVVNQIQFQTGGWDAEYGNRVAAVVNVATKIPPGLFNATVSGYGGGSPGATTIGPTGFNGQSVTMSGNRDRWGLLVSGSRQFSDMRLDPVVFDTASNRILNFHNAGTDAFGFSKLQYVPGGNDVLTLELNQSTTSFQVPFDSSGGVFINDHQRDANGFVNLGWRHQFGAVHDTLPSHSDLFAGFFFRHSSLTYTPDPNDEPSFQFFPDTIPFNISERRSASTTGIKLDYTVRPAHDVEVKAGTLSSVTTGREDFIAFNSRRTGPQSNQDLTGSDVGVYAQTAVAPHEWFEVRTGVRFDAHSAPNAGTATQVSPRLRLNFYPSTSTTAYLYYGRLFTPTNIADLRAITRAAQGGSVDLPTQPERDNFFEAALMQRFPLVGLVAKLSAYYKQSNPGIDDNTVPGSAIKTEVNIQHVRVTGIEAVLDYQPNSPLTAYLSAALAHAYGFGAITGGFFPSEPPSGPFDLDHDQRLSIVASATYAPNRFFVSGTGIYGSGLTNGVDPAACGCQFGTRLFDFNPGIKVAPSAIVNASAGYAASTRRGVVQPELYIDNLFDRKYLLKGVFFSGASVGRPRSIQLRVKATF